MAIDGLFYYDRAARYYVLIVTVYQISGSWHPEEGAYGAFGRFR